MPLSERHPNFKNEMHRISKPLLCATSNGDVLTLSEEWRIGPIRIVDEKAWILCGLKEYVYHIDDLVDASGLE
jgi:hypothetical protein